MQAESTDLWDFFDKCEGTDDKRATCRICCNIYNYNATSHNLKAHLAKKHNISIGYSGSPQSKPRASRNKIVWNFFSRVEGKEKYASCHYCDKVLSYQTTSNNLKTHLKKIHPMAYERLLQSLPTSKSETVVEYVEEEYLESNDEDDSNDGTKTTTDLWNYFESESATSSICCVCCASVSSKPADLRRHLVTEHPKLIGQFLSQDSDQNDEPFSEVIYLEEDPSTKEQKIRVKKLDLNYKKGKRARLSEEKPKSVADEEVETFGAYITCLLKQLPRDVCRTVQKEIIDVIMNAKSRTQVKNETQQSLIKEILKEINCDDSKESSSLNVSVDDDKAGDVAKDPDVGDEAVGVVGDNDSNVDDKNEEVE